MHKVMRMVLLAMLVSVLAASVLLAGCSRPTALAQGIEEGYDVGNLAPGFGLQSVGEELVSLNQFRGRPVLLNFWASWCPPCRAEMPLIQAVSSDKSLADKGLAVLTVDLGEKPATVESFMRSNSYSFTVLLDTQQIVAGVYNVRSIPTTFFIDRDGIIRNVRIGAFAGESQIMIALSEILP